MTSLLGSVTVSSAPEGTSIDSLVDVQNALVGETVQVVIQQPDDGSSLLTMENGEPAPKRQRVEEEGDSSSSIRKILFNINQAICLRLDAIENKLETVSLRTKYLEEKLESVSSRFTGSASSNGGAAGSIVVSGTSQAQPVVVMSQAVTPTKASSTAAHRRSSAVVVGLPQEKDDDDDDDVHLGGTSDASPVSTGSQEHQSVHSLGPNVTLITLNSEEDFPNGVWLGDESNPEMRVRAPITPSDLLHIHSNCRTAEKMALSLLDYLFDRDTQACSNLSGMGKHGKKQLDPLMIYGIRCHLIQRFGCTEQDWHRIKQNIDSKCRTAFRRRMRGLPLTVKAFRGKAPPTYVHVINAQDGLMSPGELQELHGTEESMGQDDSELHIHEEVDLSHPSTIMHPVGMSATELLQNAGGGQIQVLHATPEQVAQLQQTHQIQILQGDQIMHFQNAVSMSQPEGVQVITTASGQTMQIKSDPGELSQDSTGQDEEEELELAVQEANPEEEQ